MRTRRRAAIEAVVMALVLAAVVAHTAYWRATGEHSRLFDNRDWTAALYNLALMLTTGTLVALLLIRVTEAFGYEVKRIHHFDEGEKEQEEAQVR